MREMRNGSLNRSLVPDSAPASGKPGVQYPLVRNAWGRRETQLPLRRGHVSRFEPRKRSVEKIAESELQKVTVSGKSLSPDHAAAVRSEGTPARAQGEEQSVQQK